MIATVLQTGPTSFKSKIASVIMLRQGVFPLQHLCIHIPRERERRETREKSGRIFFVRVFVKRDISPVIFVITSQRTFVYPFFFNDTCVVYLCWVILFLAFFCSRTL